MSAVYELEGDLAAEMSMLGKRAREAAKVLANAGTEAKNAALAAMAAAVRRNVETILSANNKDLEAARNADLRASFIDRLSG